VLDWSGWAVAAGLAFFTFSLYHERDELRSRNTALNLRVERLNEDSASATQVMEALTDPKAARVTLTKERAPAFPIGRVVYNPQKGSLIFLASNLDPLQQYKTYELWLIPSDGHDPIPAGTFKPDDKGSASLILPELPKGVQAKAFGVTVEEDGGSQTPTLPILMAGG
jgi:anti-sigma-K factor RskA